MKIEDISIQVMHCELPYVPWLIFDVVNYIRTTCFQVFIRIINIRTVKTRILAITHAPFTIRAVHTTSLTVAVFQLN